MLSDVSCFILLILFLKKNLNKCKLLSETLINKRFSQVSRDMPSSIKLDFYSLILFLYLFTFFKKLQKYSKYFQNTKYFFLFKLRIDYLSVLKYFHWDNKFNIFDNQFNFLMLINIL